MLTSAILFTAPAHGSEHYPARDSAPTYYPSPCSQAIQFLVDRGEIFTAPLGARIEQRACDLARNDSVEIAVATIGRISRDTLPVYGEGLFQAWNIGGTQERGVLLLYGGEYGSTGQPVVWVHVGNDLRGAIGNAQRDHVVDEVRAGYDKNRRQGLDDRAATELGLARGFAALADTIERYEGDFPSAPAKQTARFGFWVGTALFLGAMAAMVAVAVVLERRSQP